MNIKNAIQHIVSVLIFLVGVVFAVLNVLGITVTVNEADMNSLIFALGSFIAACIEFIPFVIRVVKDKTFIKVTQIVKSVTDAIEELKDLKGNDKKTKALEIIIKECEAQGLDIDIQQIDIMIETAVALRNKVVK